MSAYVGEDIMNYVNAHRKFFPYSYCNLLKVKEETTALLNSLPQCLLRSSEEMPNISAEKWCHYGSFKYKLQPFQKKFHIFLYIFISLSAPLVFTSKTIFHAGMTERGQFLCVAP